MEASLLDQFVYLDTPLWLWVSTTAAAWLACIVGTAVRSTGWKEDGRRSLTIVLVSLVLPTITLLHFHAVFVSAGASNVRQENSPDGYAAWRSWTNAWIVYLFMNPACVLATSATLLMRPRTRRAAWTWIARTLAIISCGLACQYTMRHFPDA